MTREIVPVQLAYRINEASAGTITALLTASTGAGRSFDILFDERLDLTATAEWTASIKGSQQLTRFTQPP